VHNFKGVHIPTYTSA